jgi:hypothetical protein
VCQTLAKRRADLQPRIRIVDDGESPCPRRAQIIELEFEPFDRQQLIRTSYLTLTQFRVQLALATNELVSGAGKLSGRRAGSTAFIMSPADANACPLRPPRLARRLSRCWPVPAMAPACNHG